MLQNAKMAGFIVGAQVPIVLTSRSIYSGKIFITGDFSISSKIKFKGDIL